MSKTMFILFILLVAALSDAASATPISEIRSCGTYKLRGKLHDKDSGIEVLELSPGTTSRADVILHELRTGDGVGYNGRNVELEVQVYSVGKGSPPRARVLKPAHSATYEQVTKEPQVLLKKSPCTKIETD